MGKTFCRKSESITAGSTVILTEKVRPALLTLALCLALMAVGCAPIQPVNPAGPRGNEPPYPIVLAEDTLRKEIAQAAVNRLKQSAQNGSTESIELNLRPITATVESLSATSRGTLYLPKIGTAAVMNEEETRESLRRFIRSWSDLIGADPVSLSLVDHSVQPDGTSVAHYEQRAFRFPIRGDYGKLQIRFSSDRRVLSLSSTCIPDVEKVRSALRVLGASGALRARLTAEEAIKKLRENDVTPSRPEPTQLPFRVPPGAQLNPKELVTHVQPSKSQPNALEFHIAWEIELSNASVKRVYVDSMTGEVIAAE